MHNFVLNRMLNRAYTPYFGLAISLQNATLENNFDIFRNIPLKTLHTHTCNKKWNGKGIERVTSRKEYTLILIEFCHRNAYNTHTHTHSTTIGIIEISYGQSNRFYRFGTTDFFSNGTNWKITICVDSHYKFLSNDFKMMRGNKPR